MSRGVPRAWSAGTTNDINDWYRAVVLSGQALNVADDTGTKETVKLCTSYGFLAGTDRSLDILEATIHVKPVGAVELVVHYPLAVLDQPLGSNSSDQPEEEATAVGWTYPGVPNISVMK